MLQVSVLKSESPTPSEVTDDGHTSALTSLHEDERTLTRSEASEDSSKPTPDIVLKDPPSLDLLQRPTPQSSRDKLNPIGGGGEAPKSLIGDSLKAKDSFLSDLPPLGGAGKSSLSDLPPLSSGRTLAPLSKIPPKNTDSGLEPVTRKDPGQSKTIDSITAKPKPETIPTTKKKSGNLPTLGFEQDHVISEKTDSFRSGDKKHSPDISEEVTENIEEDLDSFLNSEMSGADQTVDETLHGDVSLKADYVESL